MYCQKERPTMIQEIDDSALCRYKRLPDRVWVMENPELEALLFSRSLMGVDFRKLCLEVTKKWLAHFSDEIMLAQDDLAELLILSKGIAYQVGQALYETASVNLPVNLVAPTRILPTATGCEIRIDYHRFDAGGSVLLVGDTIATGSTLIESLKLYQTECRLDRLIVLAYAGSIVGVERILAFCDSTGIDASITVGLGALHLGSNGFDMSLADPMTITADRYRLRAQEQFGGKAVAVIGWDSGSQFMAPKKYAALCWEEARYWGLESSTEFRFACPSPRVSLLDRERSAFSGTGKKGGE